MNDTPYSTIFASGADAHDFLQAQLTADLLDLTPTGTTLAAWCNPKGRVIVVLQLGRNNDDVFTLALPADIAETVVQRLKMFRFRAKVEFEIRPAKAGDVEAEQIDQWTFGAWRLQNLKAGIPEIGAAQSENFTPHMLNLDLLGAVSLDKGCYPGQEIVARTHYRGASKRRLHRFESAAPVAVADKVSDGVRNVGEVVNAIGTDILAVVPSKNIDDGLMVGEVKLVHRAIPYA